MLVIGLFFVMVSLIWSIFICMSLMKNESFFSATSSILYHSENLPYLSLLYFKSGLSSLLLRSINRLCHPKGHSLRSRMAVECYWCESSSDWQPFCCVLNSIKELKCRTPDFMIEDGRTEKIGSQLLSTWYMPGTVTAPPWVVTHLIGHMKKQKPGEGKEVPWSCGSWGGRWSAAITWLLKKPVLHCALLSVSAAALKMFPFAF